ncbi:TPA: hypothetical protein ACH3X3_006355 [Trebouxia sp. C0006]
MSDVSTQVMAKARGLWHAGKYQKSVEVMQLLGNSDLPSQAQHNKLMANFSAEDHQDPKGLLTALQALDKVATTQSSSLDTDADQYESSVLRLNMAILLVQQNKTTAALEVLEPLFEHIEPMQENVAIRVCLLLMELYLAGSNYAQAAKVLHYLETAYGVMPDSPEDKESLAGQNSDLDISGDPSQASDPSDPLGPPAEEALSPPDPPAGEQSQAASLTTPLQGSGVTQTPSPAPPKATALAVG